VRLSLRKRTVGALGHVLGQPCCPALCGERVLACAPGDGTSQHHRRPPSL